MANIGWYRDIVAPVSEMVFRYRGFSLRHKRRVASFSPARPTSPQEIAPPHMRFMPCFTCPEIARWVCQPVVVKNDNIHLHFMRMGITNAAALPEFITVNYKIKNNKKQEIHDESL